MFWRSISAFWTTLLLTLLPAILIAPRQACAAITIDNAGRTTVTCRLIQPGQAAPRDLAIAPGKVELIEAREPIECRFQSGAGETRYALQPARHYRFVTGTAGKWELRAMPSKPAPAAASRARPSAVPEQKAEPAAKATTSRWPDPRELKVVIAGGKEYRSFYRDKWQPRAQGIVEAAAARFEEQFPVHFRVVGFRDWNYKTAPQSAGDAFEWLHEVDRGDADLVIGFTLVPFPGPRGEIRGVTQYFSRCIVIPDCWGTTGATTRLVHELCHVFGAFHVAVANSVMQMGFERTPKVFQFGEAAERMLALTKDVDFEAGIESIPPDAQHKIREIYRKFHHPLENETEDPVVVGYRYQARRAGWAGDDARAEKMQTIADRLAPPSDEEPSPAEEGLQVGSSEER